MTVPVVIGVDIGTTGTRCVAYDEAGGEWGRAEVGYPLLQPAADQAVQEPDVIVDAVATTLASTAAEAAARGAHVVAVGLGSALHSLLGVDRNNRPLTPLLTWADNRATREAAWLSARDEARQLYERTGTPLHAMSPLSKLRWFAGNEPETFAAVAQWLSIKEYMLRALFRAAVVDHSVASATGLLDVRTRSWDGEALTFARVSPAQLSTLVPTTHVLDTLPRATAERLSLTPDTPVVIGAGDGPLANVGAGAVAPDVAACTVGTSGAIRVVVRKALTDPEGGLFCYVLDDEHWVVGGPVNSGGIVLRWIRDELFPDARDAAHALGENPYVWLNQLAAHAPAGAGGVTFLPHLAGERAPQWNPSLRGVVWGLSLAHGRAHLVRAALEGIAFQLRAVADALRTHIGDFREVRVTGGFTRSPLWREMLAGVLHVPVARSAVPQASCFGAAVLAMTALGMLDSTEQAARLVGTREAAAPPAGDVAAYEQAYARFRHLAQLLEPTFAQAP